MWVSLICSVSTCSQLVIYFNSEVIQQKQIIFLPFSGTETSLCGVWVGHRSQAEESAAGFYISVSTDGLGLRSITSVSRCPCSSEVSKGAGGGGGWGGPEVLVPIEGRLHDVVWVMWLLQIRTKTLIRWVLLVLQVNLHVWFLLLDVVLHSVCSVGLLPPVRKTCRGGSSHI